MAEVVVKATVVLHNILTVPGDAFEDLANVGNQPRQGPAAVHECMKDYFNSDYGGVPWQNEAAYVHSK